MELEKFGRGSRWIVVAIVVIFVVILGFILYLLFWEQGGLSLGSNIKEALVSSDGGKVQLILDNDMKEGVVGTKVVFTDGKGGKYYYNVDDFYGEIEIGVGEVVSNESDLENFNKIEKVEVVYGDEEIGVVDVSDSVDVRKEVVDAPVLSAMTIEQFGITWTFDKQYPYGQFANGDYWVVGPVTIIDITPKSRYYPNQVLSEDASKYPNGRLMHGSMINPEVSAGTSGFDSYLGDYPSNYDWAYDYQDVLNVARPNNQDLSSGNPLVVGVGSSLVSVVSRTIEELDADSGGTTASQTKVAAILTVLDAPAPFGSFRPPYVGDDKQIKFNSNDVDLSMLQDLEITDDIRSSLMTNKNAFYLEPNDGFDSLSQVVGAYERNFQRPWIDFMWTSVGYHAHPYENMPRVGYGRDLSKADSNLLLVLNLNLSSEGISKKENVISLIQAGIDLAGAYDGGMYWYHNGGIYLGRMLPVLFAGVVLNDEHMKNAGSWKVLSPRNCYGTGRIEMPVFQEQSQVFYVTQRDVDITNSPDWDPDIRNPTLTYKFTDIGIPDWGIRHFCEPEYDNKHIDSTYRSVVSGPDVGTALVLQIMDLKEEFNQDVFFDYADRWFSIYGDLSGTNAATDTARAIWKEYRNDYGCVWTRNDLSDIYSQGSCR